MFPAQTGVAIEAKSYWQHTGEIVSSRRASAALQDLGVDFERITAQFGGDDSSDWCRHGSAAVPSSDQSPFEELRGRISEVTSQPEENVFLCPSGMQVRRSESQSDELKECILE